MPHTVWLFGLASLLNDASSEAVFPLLGLFLGTLGAPMGFVGLAMGAADTLAVGIKIVAGYVADRVPRRPLVVTGYLVAAVGRAGLALAVVPWHVLGLRTLDRAGKGIRSGSRDAMLSDAVEIADRGRAFGVTQSLDHLGAAVGPLIASVCLASGWSLRATFLLAGALGLAAPVVLALRLPEIPRRADDAAASSSAQPNPSDDGRVPRPLVAYLVVCGLFACANSSDAFILIRAGTLGWTPATLPLLWLAHHLVKSVTTAVGGSLSDRVPRARLIIGGWLAFAIAYAGFAASTRRWHVLALLLFYALYHGLAEAPERALVSDLAGRVRRGRAFGLYHGIVGLAALPAGLLTGWLWDHFGPAAAFGTCAALALAAAVGLFVLVRAGVVVQGATVG